MSQSSTDRPAQHARAVKEKKLSLRAKIICGLVAVILVVVVGVTLFVNFGRTQLTDPSIRASHTHTLERDGKTYAYNPDIVSFLFIGCDQENGRVAKGYNGQCDALMLVALDTASGKITTIAVPRDSWTEIRHIDPDTREDLGLGANYLCLAFSYGEDNMQSGALTCEAVSHLLGNIPLDYFYILDMSGVAPLADAIGGVELIALQDVTESNIAQGDEVLLKGQAALDYVWRRNVADDYSPGKRLERQAQFVKAFGNKALSEIERDPFALSKLLDVASSYSTTNISAPEFAYIAWLLATSDTSSENGSQVGDPRTTNANETSTLAGVTMLSLPGSQVAIPSRPTIFHVDEDATEQMVLDVFFIEQE